MSCFSHIEAVVPLEELTEQLESEISDTILPKITKINEEIKQQNEKIELVKQNNAQFCEIIQNYENYFKEIVKSHEITCNTTKIMQKINEFSEKIKEIEPKILKIDDFEKKYEDLLLKNKQQSDEFEKEKQTLKKQYKSEIMDLKEKLLLLSAVEITQKKEEEQKKKDFSKIFINSNVVIGLPAGYESGGYSCDECELHYSANTFWHCPTCNGYFHHGRNKHCYDVRLFFFSISINLFFS